MKTLTVVSFVAVAGAAFGEFKKPPEPKDVPELMVSTYSTKNVGIEADAPDIAAEYCEKAIPKKQLKGYIFGPWTLTVQGVPRDKYMASLPVVENMFKRFGH